MSEIDPLDLLIELRGGLPERCDFCGGEYHETRLPVPEEGGEWACTDCVARWDHADDDTPDL